MKEKKIDAELGLLVVDWFNRKIEWFGADGCGGYGMDFKEVLAKAAKYKTMPQFTVQYLILWHDNHQLSVHDESGFLEETTTEDEGGSSGDSSDGS